MKFILVTLSALVISATASAAYPFNVTCTGISAKKNKINVAVRGLVAANPATGKTTLRGTLNVTGKTERGLVEVKDLDITGTKVTSGTLIMYTIMSVIPNSDFNSVAVAITNKTGNYNTLTFIDTLSPNVDTEEFTITCNNPKE